MVTRFLDWLDESAAGVIRVAYLLAGVIAVASYFSDGHVPSGLAQALNAILPWALAGALEVHTYLSARRVRAAWQDMQAAKLGSDEHQKAEASMRLNLWILGGLLVFSCYNQLQYLAATWKPPATPLTPPAPWAYIIRAVITPSAFMCAAFLAPMGEGMAAQVQREASNLARLAFKAAAAQWKRRLQEMQQQQQDVTGALVGLVEDPSERRVIAGIWQAMHPGQSLAMLEAPESPYTAPYDGLQSPEAMRDIALHSRETSGASTRTDAHSVPPKPPTGPGRPRRASKQSKRVPATPPAILRLPAERRVAAIIEMDPDVSVRTLAARAHVSESTASKYGRLYRRNGKTSAGDLAQ